MSARHLLPLLPALPMPAWAQASPPAADLGGSVVQLLLGLAVVIALLFASLWLLKRIAAPRGQAAGLLKVIAGAAVGARERVVILEVGDTWLVLGVAPGRVTALAEVPRSPLPTSPPPQGKDFAGWLKAMMEQRRDGG